MSGLFDPLTLKDAQLRTRIAVSPITQYAGGTDDVVTDWHPR